MSVAEVYCARARALVGCRFRPQGREPSIGLDCVGLVAATFDIAPEAVSRNYRLRGDHLARLRAEAQRFFRPVPSRHASAGDLMLFHVSPEQLHLAVKTDAGFVHAHAGLGCVVETPGEPPWRVTATYRRRRTGLRTGA